MSKIFFPLTIVALLSIFIVLVNSEEALKIEVIEESADCSRKAKKDDIISMHYAGKLTNGKEFDSSYSRNQPFEFKLGAGQVIPGWEQGVPGMCVGEKRRLTVPPALAYGDQGFGDIIPAKSTLVFEIMLVAIKDDDGSHSQGLDSHDEPLESEHQHPDTFEAIDENNDKQISSEEMVNYLKKFSDGESEQGIENFDTIVSEIFQEDDKNKDGVISYEEFQHSQDQDDIDELSETETPMLDDDEENDVPFDGTEPKDEL